MPILVTAEDITSAITRIDAAAQGVNAVFVGCTAIDQGTSKAWNAWYTGWQAWAKANSNLNYFTLGLPAIGNQAVAYEDDMVGWIEDADRICGAAIPSFATQTKVADQNAALSPGWSAAIEALKFVAGAVVVAIVVPPIVEAVRSPFRSKKLPTP